jgi:hypothetical protein
MCEINTVRLHGLSALNPDVENVGGDIHSCLTPSEAVDRESNSNLHPPIAPIRWLFRHWHRPKRLSEMTYVFGFRIHLCYIRTGV